MLFIGLALIIAVGLGLLISADAGSLVGLSQQQFGQLVPLVIILVVFAAGAFARRRKAGEMIGNLAIWIGILGLSVVGYTYRDDVLTVANKVFGELVPGRPVIDSVNHTASFSSGRDGHFLVGSTIDGVDLTLLFDTGASAVVLSFADARKAGIDTGNLRFEIPVSTANGTGRAAVVTLDSMEVGGIKRSKIRAFVAESGALEGSLLGMSFLETLKSYGVKNGQLQLAD